MGKIKHLKKIEEFIEKSAVFNIRDIKKLVPNPDYANLLLHNMVKKGKINRLLKGYYSKFDDPHLIAYCIKPSYIGLESALSLHNLWEQETNVVLLTIRRVRSGIRKVQDANVVVKQINPNHFFGFEHINYYDFRINVSDIEKTLIDLVFYKKYIDQDLITEFRKKVNLKKLKGYLKNYDNEFADKVKNLLK